MTIGLEMKFETEEVNKMLQGYLNKVQRPRPLIKNLQRWIKALTMLMFRGRRPDKTAVRGVKWKPLSKSTIARKKNLKKRGKLHGGATPSRPMVASGKTRDTHKVLREGPKGFEYGTKHTSKKGFKYPGHHNTRDFPWLFIGQKDMPQMIKMVIDFLQGQMKNAKSYK